MTDNIPIFRTDKVRIIQYKQDSFGIFDVKAKDRVMYYRKGMKITEFHPSGGLENSLQQYLRSICIIDFRTECHFIQQ